MNWQPSLFDHFTDPYRPGDTPLAEYTDQELGTMIAGWGEKTL